MKGRFVVITADIIGSRESLKSGEVLDRRLDILNERFEGELAAPFKAYRGDEIQCVVKPTADLLKVIRCFRYYLKPLELRIGIGKGSVDRAAADDQRLANPNPWENNGKAFYLARDCVEYLAKHRSLSRKPRTFFRTDLEDEPAEAIVNTMLNLYDIVLEAWTRSQWDSIIGYEQSENLVQTAEQLKKKYQSIQRSVGKAGWEEIRADEHIINRQIQSC
jgi:hypothetical protein